MRIHTGDSRAHRRAQTIAGGELLQDMVPDFLLRPRATHTEARLVHRVVRARDGLDLTDGAIAVAVGAERDPAGLWVSLRRHQGEGFVVRIEHQHARIDRHPAYRGVDEDDLVRRDAPNRREEPVLWRLKLRQALLEDLDYLGRRHRRAAQPHLVGLLPEPPEALQRSDEPALVDVARNGASWRDTAWRVNPRGGTRPVV